MAKMLEINCLLYTWEFSRVLHCAEVSLDPEGFLRYAFADHQVISLSHCIFSRIKILSSASLQRNPQSFLPLKITVYMVFSAINVYMMM